MPEEIDPYRQLAATFAQMADSVDAYRTAHLAELSPNDRQTLQLAIQHLQDVHDNVTLAAIQDSLNAMQSDLARITEVTKQAQQALHHLQTIAEVVKLVSAASELAEDIAIADYGAIPQSIEDIIQALPQKPDKNTSSSPGN